MTDTKCSNFTGSIITLFFSWFGKGAALPYNSLWRRQCCSARGSNGWNKFSHLLKGYLICHQREYMSSGAPMLRVQANAKRSQCTKKLRLFFTSAFDHNLTLSAYSMTAVLANFQVPGHQALQIYTACWAFRRYLCLVSSCVVFHGTDNVWPTGMTSRSCKRRFSCICD